MIEGIRDIPGLAPKAATFNRLAKNLESLNSATAFRGALIKKTANQSINPGNFNTEIIFAATVYDTTSFWSAGTPNRLTVPSGVTKVKLKGSILAAATQTVLMRLEFYKNGAFIDSNSNIRPIQDDGSAGINVRVMGISSPAMIVSASDYFTLRVTLSNAGAAWTVNAHGATWFSMEVIE